MKSRGRRRAAADFFIGFFATVLLIFPVFFAVFETSKARRSTPSPEAAPAAETRTDIPVSAPLSFNLLVEMHSSLTGELLSVSMLRFDTVNKRVCAVTLPADSVMLWDEQPVTLMSLFPSRGALGIKKALEDTLSIPISGYISVTSDTMSEILDELGGFAYTLERPIEITDSEGRTVYRRDAGTATLYGSDVIQLVTSGVYRSSDLVHLHERLWEAALGEMCVREDFGDDLARCIELVRSDSPSTDLNPVLTGELRRAADYVCGPDCLAEVMRPDGVFADMRFELSEGADEKLWRLFPKV